MTAPADNDYITEDDIYDPEVAMSYVWVACVYCGERDEAIDMARDDDGEWFHEGCAEAEALSWEISRDSITRFYGGY